MTEALLKGEARAPESQWTLWYRQPATEWEEQALPLGNGRLGAMVFGGVHRERIQLNDDSLWAGSPADRINPKSLESLPEVRRLLFEGKNDEAVKLAGDTMMGIPRCVESYEPLGDLFFDFELPPHVSEYRRELDIRDGIARVSFVSDGSMHLREVFSSAADQVLVVKLSTDHAGGMSVTISLSREERSMVSVSQPGRLELAGRAASERNEGMSFAALLDVQHEDGKIEPDGQGLRVSGASEIILRLTSATSLRHADPGSACAGDLATACEKSYAALREMHVADHRSLFDRVQVDLGRSPAADRPTDERLEAVRNDENDPQLAALYFQYGRYLLMGSSRPGCLPANLQGIWNDKMKAPWNADFHTNVNLQMNYWPAEVCNLSECHLPLFDLMDSLVEPGGRTARLMYDADGWVVHHLTDVWGFTVPADGPQGIWPMGSAWLARHPWEHYCFTGDVEFLRERGFPLMKGAARFILDFLVEAPAGTPAAGKLVTNPSHSPENSFVAPDGTSACFTYAATMDLQIIRELFENCLEALDALGADTAEDAALRREIADALSRLAPMAISSKTGTLQEWIEDYDETDPHHRHISHLYGLYPAAQISPTTTPELAAAARRSVERRGDGGTGWSKAWKINTWARLLDGDHAHKMAIEQLIHSTYDNLLDAHPPFQIDGNFGGAAGIAEMLLQSHTGELHLLPALPSAWPTGSVRGLKARGGYEVSIHWQDCALTEAQIVTSSDGPCRVRTGVTCGIQAGGVPVPCTTADSEVVEFVGKSGMTYRVVPGVEGKQ